MTISRSTSIVNGVMFVLICCVALLVLTLYRNVEGNIRMNRQKEVALQLANELMQSSEQLTNNVREYAVTGDERYEKTYLAIVDERAGKIPRAQSKSVAPGRSVSLMDLMRENGFTEQEFALVKQANDLSNELVVLETKAMNAVKGITAGPDGSEVRGNPDMELARSLVFGADYKQQTDKIMQPMAEFFRSLSARTAAEVEESRARVMRSISLLAVTLLLLAGALVYSFIFVRRGICRPLADTARFARQVIEGDHSSRLHNTSQNEVGELARALDSMLDKLVAELAFSKGVLSSMPIPVMVCDTEEVIRFVNAPMLALFAHTGDPESYEGTGMRAFIGADDDRLNALALGPVERFAESAGFELLAVTPSGKPLPGRRAKVLPENGVGRIAGESRPALFLVPRRDARHPALRGSTRPLRLGTGVLSVEAMKRNLLLILAPEREGLVPPLPGRIAQRMASGEAYRAGAAETPISFKTETQR